MAGFWVLLAALAAPAVAAEPDLRLIDAVAAQDAAAVAALLKQKVNVNTARVDGVTALLWAAHFNNLDLVNQLLAAGAKPDLADDHGVTPLARAAENANLAIVERLLQAGASPNAAQDSGLAPLMVAAHTGSIPVVKTLLAHGANVNATTKASKTTALMWAVGDQHHDMARMFIEAGADVHVSTAKGFNALMLAARNGDIEMAKILMAAGVGANEASSDGTQALPYAIVSGKPDFAFFLLERGADPNGRMEGLRAIHAAAGGVGTWLDDWNRRHGAAGALVSAGSGGRGISPQQRLDLVKALLARGADPNARIETSAMIMAYIGYPKKGAFESFACGTGDLWGASPLWVVSYTANGGSSLSFDGGRMSDAKDTSAEIIRTLVAAGAKVDLPTVDGTTPLMAAAGLGGATFVPGLQRGRRSTSAEDAVKALLDAGANINAVNEADFTALHGAAFRGLNEVIQILVDRGGNINARDYRGRTPYRIAEGSKQSFQFQAYPETAEFIKTLGANTSLGIPGTVQERLRDVPGAVANPQ
jgi:ankyrin repeat protein